jgi:DNA-binding response OmpR family regulator
MPRPHTKRKPRILVAQDDLEALQLITRHFAQAGYEVEEFTDGAAAIRHAQLAPPSLMILDVILPGTSGFDACRLLKKDAATAAVPIILLSSKAEEHDRVIGLELGADDYLAKPFSPRELLLRVQAILRAASAGDPPAARDTLTLGRIEICRSRLEVKAGGKIVELTATEYKLLVLLAERCGRLQSRDTLLAEVWGYESLIETRTVDTHVRRLRTKLGNCAAHIETVRGAGYRGADR